jgi:uncharacterized YccA/Bax inhibitor family protein
MEKSGNPALKKSALDRISSIETSAYATVGGTVFKTVILLVLMAIGAFSGWRITENQSSNFALILMGSFFGALIFSLITIFAPKVSGFTSPIYAILEGVVLGAISQIFNTSYDGIVVQAVLLTFGIFISVLILYTSGAVKVTQKTRAIIIVATLGVGIYYLFAIIIGLFGFQVPLIYDSGTFGIIFSLIVVFIASLNLLLDFDFIEKTSKSNAPKVFEWYGAFSLMITLVWLYLEILRLLGKMKS